MEHEGTVGICAQFANPGGERGKTEQLAQGFCSRVKSCCQDVATASVTGKHCSQIHTNIVS